MEGDRRIQLLEPGPVVADGYGEEIPSDPVPYIVWARRSDRGGTEGLQSSTQVGEWDTRFEIRQEPRLNLVGNWKSWSVVDEYSREYDIETVSEAPMGRRRHWWLFCVTRS